MRCFELRVRRAEAEDNCGVAVEVDFVGRAGKVEGLAKKELTS